MNTTPVIGQKAKTNRKTFSRETSISVSIEADASTVWTLLTDASDFTRWNTTVTFLEGRIEEGEKIKLKSVLDEKRVFKLKVKELVPNSRMVWGDGKGNRVHTIYQNSDGAITFTMTEKIGGLMFPMYAKYIPPFDETFEQYAKDLKDESERIFRSK